MTRTGGRVVVLAENASLAAEARTQVRRSAVGTVEFRRLVVRRRSGPDPYALRELLDGCDVDAAVIVTDARRGPRAAVPTPVVAGVPVAFHVPRRSPVLAAVAPSSDAPWVVAAMAKDVFLRPTDSWAATLHAAGQPAVDLRADRARSSELLAALRDGPGVVLYAGHGRPVGWSGYQALRWRHFEDDREPRAAAGTVVAFACDTLKRSRGCLPFGMRMVAAGVARCYLGAVTSIRTDEATALAHRAIGVLAADRPGTAGELVIGIERAVADDAGARRAWRCFRLVGDPTTPLVVAEQQMAA